MAKRRRSLTLGDIERSTPSWAQKYRQEYLKRREDQKNKEAKADSIVRALAEENPNLTDDQLAEIFSRVVAGEDFDVPETLPAQEESAPAVSAQQEAPRPKGLVERFAQFHEDMAGLLTTQFRMGRASDPDAAFELQKMREREGQPASEEMGLVLGGSGLGMSPNYRRANLTDQEREGNRTQRVSELEARVAESKKVLEALTPIAQQYRRSLDQSAFGQAPAIVAEAVAGVASQPEQLLPIAGGIAGGAVAGPVGAMTFAAAAATIPAQTAYKSAYLEAINEFGATPEEAHAYALAITGVEYGTEAIGGIGVAAAGKLGGLFFKEATRDAVKDALAKKVRGRAARIVGGALAEGTSELAAEELGRGVRKYTEENELLGTEEARSRLRAFNELMDQERARNNAVSFTGGALFGGGVNTITGSLAYAAELGQQEATTRRRSLDTSAKALAAEAARKEAEAIQRSAEQAAADFIRQPRVATDAERAEAQQRRPVESFEEYAQRTADSMPVRQEDLPADAEDFNRMPAVQRTNRQRQEAGELFAEATGRVVPTQKDLTRDAENTARQLEAEQQERVDLGKYTETLRKEKTLLDKQTQKEREKQERAAKAADNKRRREVARQLLQEFPDRKIDDPEMARMLRERLAQPAQQQKKSDAGKPAKESAPVTNKKDRDLAKEEADAYARELARKQGFDVPDALSMQGEADADTSSDFIAKASSIIHNLVRKNTNATADVQNLLRQGKLVLVPNQASIGRTSTEALAEYDPKDNKMYLYTDRLSPDDAVGAVMRALHEGTHAGQFNDRQGRPSIYAQMMSKEKNNEASNRIRNAARGGNKLAQEAVRQAQAADPDANIQDLELVPYFVSEAVKARGKTFGQLRGTANDIVRAAKDFLRRYTGADLDVSLAEIESAAQRVGQEIVETDMSQPRDGESLSIVAGQRGAGAARAEAEGRSWTGSVDKLFRYEVADNEAELDRGLVKKGLDAFKDKGAAKIRLGNLLKHLKLYEEYPNLKNMYVFIKDLGEAWGQFDPSKKEINISPTLVGYAANIPDAKSIWSDNPAITNYEFLRNVLLHEVQHAVQDIEGFVPGTSDSNFIPSSTKQKVDTAKKKLDSIVKNFDLGRAEETLSPSALRAWRNELAAAGPVTRDARAELFLAGKYYEDSSDRMVQRYGPQYDTAFEEWVQAKDDYNSAAGKAYELYRRDAGELEARTVEARSRKTPEELAATPFEDDTVNAPYGLPMSEALDTTPYSGGRNLPSLAMADPDARQQKREAIQEALSPKEKVRRIVMSATRAQTADLRLAETLDKKWRWAVKEDTKQTDLSPEQQEEVVSMLQIIDEADVEQRQKKWKEFSEKWPNIAKVLEAARAEIDRRTDSLIKGLLGPGVKLQDDEAKLVITLLKNRGRYLTRAYNAFQGAQGRAWRERRWDTFNKYADAWKDEQERSRLKRRLSKEKIEHIEAVQNAIDMMATKYTIPEDTVLVDMSMPELEAMFEDYGGRLRDLTFTNGDSSNKRVALIEALGNLRDTITPQQREAMAKLAVESLLGLTPKMPNYAKVMSQLVKDPGTLKKKDFVPEEIRTLLGEMTNPGARILTTLATQGALLARQQVFLDLLNNHEGTLIVHPSKITEPGVRESLTEKHKVGRDRAPVQLSGPQYGILDGYWVHPHVADAIITTTETYNTLAEALDIFNENPSPLLKEGLKAATKITAPLTRTEKVMSVVYNPARWIGNYAGSFLQLMSNGNIRLKSLEAIKEGHGASLDYIVGSAFGGTTPRLQDAFRYVGLEAADVGEIQHILGNSIKDYMDGKIGNDSVVAKLTEAANKPRRAAHRFAVAGYASTDNWTKYANFIDRYNVVKEYYDKLGVKISDEDIKREAGNTTNYTNISYERVPEVLRGFEKMGMTEFIPYFYEAFRTKITNFHQAYLDLKRAASTDNPEARAVMIKAALRRTIGNLVATTALPMAGMVRHPLLSTGVGLGILAAMAGEDDHENLRRMISDFGRDQDLFNFGVDAKGNPVFISISDYFDPAGPVNDVLRVFLNTPTEELPEAYWDMVVDLVISPKWLNSALRLATGQDLPEATIAQMAPEWTERMQTLASTIGIDSPTTVNNALRVMDSWLPGIVKAQAPYSTPNIANPQPLEINGMSVPYAKDTAQLATLMNNLGFRFETLNPESRMKQYARESKDAKASNRRWLADQLTLSQNLTEDRLMSIVYEYADRETDRLKEDYKNVQSLREWKYNDAYIAAILAKNKWSKEEQEMLMSGAGFPVISLKSFTDRVTNRLDTLPESQRDAYIEKAKKVLKMIEDNKKEIQELGIVVKEK